MVYSKQNWADGQTITAAKLNAMDDEIALPPSGFGLGYQYLSASESTIGEVWFNVDRPGSANDYRTYPKFSLPAGTYYFEACSTPFTFAVDSDGNHKFSEWGNVTAANAPEGVETYGKLVLDKDAVIYFTGKNNVKSKLMTSERNANIPFEAASYIIKTIEEPKEFHVGSSREYTSLKDAVAEAIKYPYSTVYLDGETFDLVEEFGGQGALDSWTPDPEYVMYGIFLGNGITIKGTPYTKITFDYQGTNDKIYERFSPFNFNANLGLGFTLDTITIESKNCRYSVHDEAGGNKSAYRNVYRNCTFTHDSTGCTWGAHQAIGGGLGEDSLIEIENCNMTSVGIDDTISYHNPGASSNVRAKNLIYVKDSYLSGTTLFANYGNSDDMSIGYTIGCSLGLAPKLERKVVENRKDNMKILEWGNTIRGVVEP